MELFKDGLDNFGVVDEQREILFHMNEGNYSHYNIYYFLEFLKMHKV